MNRALRWFAIGTWAAAAALVAIFALFWRLAYAPPHAFWAISTTGAVMLAGALTILAGIVQFIRGPRRLFAVAIMFLGTTPIVWLATIALSLYLQQTSRAPTTIDTRARIVAFWAESIGDIEARWRYPRWTEGQHVILLDDDEKLDPQKLVAQMDTHIEQMAALFHLSVPPAKARWVRGSLLGVHGAAIISWAICDGEQNSADLTPLDRHEMAHVLITALGSVDQDPPMLLCEGWAETQSKSREDLILKLGQIVETGPIYSLEELVGADWYGRSAGPVYDHGGPLCLYLMEHYGVDKFLALYHGVRHATFAVDSERILGDSWKVVEDDFWKWLSNESAKIKNERGIKPVVLEPEKEITFAKSVDEHDWQAILDGYRTAWPKRRPLPTAIAFVREHQWTRPPTESGGAQVEDWMSSKYVVDGDCVWRLQGFGPDRFSIGEVFTPKLSAFVVVKSDGRVDTYRSADKTSVVDAIDDAARWADTCDLARRLPIDRNRHYGINVHIEAIRRPAMAGGAEWELECVSRTRDKGEETRCKLWIDSAADWSVVREEKSSPGEHVESRSTMGNVLGRTAPKEIVERTTNSAGTSSFRLRFRDLSPAEAQEVQEKAEEIARRNPETKWYSALVRPLTLAIAWPATGALLLFAGILMGRRNHFV